MNTLSRRTAVAFQNIQRFIQGLYQLYLKYKTKYQEIHALNKGLAKLDSDNQEFANIEGDKAETMRMTWLCALTVLMIIVDFLTVFESCRIISELMGVPNYIVFLFPLVLVLVEIGISYFQLEAYRKGQQGSWLTKNAQYVVLVIICGLVGMSIFYSIDSYSKESDGSFWAYLVGTLMFQIALGVASILMHLWMIRNAESIFEAVSYCTYKIKRNRIVRRIAKLEKDRNKKGLPRFSQDSQSLIHKIEQFYQENPDVKVDFTKTMPEDLKQAIEMVMGKKILSDGNRNAA